MTDTSTLELSPAPTVSDEPYVSLTVLSDMRLVIEPTQIARGGEHNSALFKIVSQPSSLDPYACRAEAETPEGSTYRLVVDGEFRLTIDMAVTGIGRLQLVYSDGVITRKTHIAQFYVTPSLNAVDQSDPDFLDGLAQLQSRVFAGASITGNTLAFQNLGGLEVDAVILPAGGDGGGIPDVPEAPGAYARVRTTSGPDAGTSWMDFNALGVAPTNSPQFTGAPTAPSPAPGDATPRLATTQFVAADFLNRAGGQMTGPLIAATGTGLNNVGLGIGDGATGFYRTGNTMAIAASGDLVAQVLPPTREIMFVYGINAAVNRIINVGDPTIGADALNLRTGDVRYLQQAGGIVTGPLQLMQTPVVANDVTNKVYVDSVVAPNALRTFAYTPNDFSIAAPSTAQPFLDVNVPLPAGAGFRNVLVSITPLFVANDPQGTNWELFYSTDLIALESSVMAYKISNNVSSFFRSSAQFIAAVDPSAGSVRVLCRVRCISTGTALTQAGVGGSAAPNMRTIVTVQDLGPVT